MVGVVQRREKGMTLCVLGRRNKDGTAELAGAATRQQWGAQDGQRKMKPEQSSAEQRSAAQHRMRGIGLSASPVQSSRPWQW